MAAANRRPKAILVKKASVDQANSFLGTLPEKTREEFSLREAVNRLQQPIRNALSKGYSYEEIAGILADQGVTISSSTLKNYVPAGGRRSTQDKASGTSNRRSKTSADETAVVDEPETETPEEDDDDDDSIDTDQTSQAEVEEEPDTTPEPEPEAKPRGRRARSTSSTSDSKSSRKPASSRSEKTTTTRRRRKSSAAE